MTISVRLVPNIRLAYLPPGLSLPRPYDGNGLRTGHSLSSLTRKKEEKHNYIATLYVFKYINI